MNNVFGHSSLLLGQYAGMRIAEDLTLVDPYEDWSAVRSPGRARRRRHKHPQRIVVKFKPKREGYVLNGTMYLHPEIVRELRTAVRS